MNTDTEEKNHAKDQAKAQYESICEMVEALEKAHKEEGHDAYLAIDEARENIQNDALEVSVRSAWTHVGGDFDPAEFKILLCWGGPACRIIGDIDRGQPSTARLEYQDWGTPWTEYMETDDEILLAYCREFYFGDV